MGEWQVAQVVAGDSRSGRRLQEWGVAGDSSGVDSTIESIRNPRNVLSYE